MLLSLPTLKGIHPGKFLEQEIRRRNLVKGQLALDCREYAQTLTAITKGTRNMNTALSLRLEKALGLEEGFLMQLQVFYDIEQEKKKHRTATSPMKLRPILFWDTRLKNIDWDKHAGYVIRRVFERGNAEEKRAVIDYYGTERIEKAISNLTPSKK